MGDRILDTQRHFDAYDAHSGAATVALLILVIGGLNLIVAGGLPFHSPAIRIVHVCVAALALVYLWVRRGRPHEGISAGISWAMIVSVLALCPLYAVWWTRLGRPVEAFVLPQLGMVCAALVVPRFAWLGVSLVGAFAIESLAIWGYVRTAEHATALVPRMEPLISMAYAVVGIGLVWLRQGRRRAVLAYLVTQAETRTLESIADKLQQMGLCLQVAVPRIFDLLSTLRGEPGHREVARRMEGPAERLTTLATRIALTAHDDEARPGSPRPPEVKVKVEELERAFLERDMQDAALKFAAVVGVASGLGIVVVYRMAVAPGAAFFAGLVTAALGASIWLVVTRSRPRVWRALVVTVALLLPLFPIIAYNHLRWAEMTRAVELLSAPKIAMVVVPVVLPSIFWLGAAFEAAMAGESIILFYTLGFQAQRDRFALSEPWLTLLYALVGMAYVLIRDQRRVASLRLLRADAELTRLARHAGISMALLDQSNNPLQVLRLHVDTTRRRHGPSALLDDLEERIAEIATATLELRLAAPGELRLSRETFEQARVVAALP